MKRKNKQDRKKQKKKNILKTPFAVVLFSLLCSLFACVYYHYQLQNYENGVIEVYALQQDNYVQLVLDQINLVKDRNDTEIIQNILGTLDASVNKYWTLSKEETLVFVRDVTESNKYHGFTQYSYYISDSAQIFVSNLNVNHVTHQLVRIGELEYIASGVKFDYNGAAYQICLLTNPDTILDHNAYLGAKINLTIMMGLVLSIFVIVSVAMGLWLEKMNRAQLFIENENVSLRRTIEKLNAALDRQELYDTRTAVFDGSLVPLFLEKLQKKQTLPVTLIRFTFAVREDMEVFLTGSQMVLGRKYLRFRLAEDVILVIGIRAAREDAKKALKLLGDIGDKVTDCLEIDRDLDEKLAEYREKWNL